MWNGDDWRDQRRELKRFRREMKQAVRYGRPMPPMPPGIPIPAEMQIEDQNEPLEVRVRKRVERRIRLRNEFYSSLVAFVAVNILLWGIWYMSGVWFPWPLFVTFWWGRGLFAQWTNLNQNSGRALDRREEEIQRELARERQRMGLEDDDDYEKPKRGVSGTTSSTAGLVRISEEGELIPADDEDNTKRGSAKTNSNAAQ